MEGWQLKYEWTEAGCYVYLSGPEKDIIISEELITDPAKCQAITDYIDRVQPRIFAYRRYRIALNDVLTMCRAGASNETIASTVEGILNQFCDLDLPGDTRKNNLDS